jgi:hypothetical protein
MKSIDRVHLVKKENPTIAYWPTVGFLFANKAELIYIGSLCCRVLNQF